MIDLEIPLASSQLPPNMLSLIFIALLAPLALVLRRVYHSIRSSSSYNGIPRPPLVADWIPFIGNALGMTRGDAFWRENVARYGPAFRVRAMGEVRTFVTSPQVSFPARTGGGSR